MWRVWTESGPAVAILANQKAIVRVYKSIDNATGRAVTATLVFWGCPGKTDSVIRKAQVLLPRGLQHSIIFQASAAEFYSRDHHVNKDNYRAQIETSVRAPLTPHLLPSLHALPGIYQCSIQPNLRRSPRETDRLDSCRSSERLVTYMYTIGLDLIFSSDFWKSSLRVYICAVS